VSISFIYIYIFGFLVVVGFMQSVTLHTNVGELKCEIFCDEVPKTAEVCVSSNLPPLLSLSPILSFCRSIS
jgi:hypothetical protein